MPTITAHCLVKNEENFIAYAVRSVINFVDACLIYDTGSTDKTVKIAKELAREFPGKIIFAEKGACDKARHTALRQEMVAETKTDWFMIVDGDEVWTNRAISSAVNEIQTNSDIICLIAPFYLCVGDVSHYSTRGVYEIRGRLVHATPRFFKISPGIHWQGAYNSDAVVDAGGNRLFERNEGVKIMEQKFWHLSHLARTSAKSDAMSSGGGRLEKRRLTYFWRAKRIIEPLPEVFGEEFVKANTITPFKSFLNFIKLLIQRIFNFL